MSYMLTHSRVVACRAKFGRRIAGSCSIEQDLYTIVEFPRPRERNEALQRAIQSGWLSVVEDGKIDCSGTARAHYDQLEGKTVIKAMGAVAAPRQIYDAYEPPPLSKKYMTNSRGTRADVPAWSVRTNTTFYAKA